MVEKTYEKEDAFLSRHAKKSSETLGRDRKETPCKLRTDFQRDRDRIIHCKAFRRLKNKTQVFISPEGDHFRTRLTHTLDVSQISRTIARSLSLNEDLSEAIALGHDLGHTPFGHGGERILSELSGHFLHNEQSLRVVEVLENDGVGLNLTKEVRDGILHHKKNGTPMTLEGKVVSFADRIAYINHDIDDSLRAGVIKSSDLPKKEISLLGKTSSERINTMVFSIFDVSEGKNEVDMKKDIKEAADSLREFMFEKVYFHKKAKNEEDKARMMIELLYKYFYDNIDKLPNSFHSLLDKYDKKTVVCDYISSMTDRYAVHVFESIYIPKSWDL